MNPTQPVEPAGAHPAGAHPAREELERHGAWLRRLARGLLYDRAGADDLVQAAWLAALRHGPPREGTQGAWLAGAVRKLALQWTRESARRERRERAAARPEATGDPGGSLERLEVTQVLVEAVRALDEPYRTALLWRFFDGLSVREIARRRGVPLETVRTHVKRGLEQVRRRIDAKRPGRREELLGALAPLAGPMPLVLKLGGAAVGKAALKGAGAMGAGGKLGLVVVGLVVAGITLWTLRATGEDRERAPNGDGAALARLEPSRDVTAPAPVPEPAAAAPDVERVVAAAAPSTDGGAFVVRGRALLNDETPIAGALVELRVYAGPEATGEPLRREVVEADAEGCYRWPIAAPDELVTLWACEALPDYKGYPITQPVHPSEPAPDQLDVRAYLLDFRVTGYVRDVDGDPIEGVRVNVAGEEVSTDVDGHYSAGLSSSRSMAFVEARAPGWAQARQVVEPKGGTTEHTVDFELRRELRVVGRVEDENGNALEGAEVSSFYTHGNEATTALDGSYTLHSLDPGRPEHSISARKEGYVLATERIETRGRDEVELVLRLARGVRVEGRVVDEVGEPIAAARLYVGFSPHAYDRLDAVADQDGAFVFAAVPRGAQTLVTQSDDLAADSRQIQVPAEGDVLGGLEIVLSTGRFLAGTVLGEDDEPVAGLSISAKQGGEYIDNYASTDAEGRFRLEHLPDSDVGLEVYGQGILRLEQDVSELDRDDLVVRVQRAARIAGTVVDGPTGAPLDSFRIRFVDPTLEEGDERMWGYGATWSREGHLFTDTDGTWDTGDEDLPRSGFIGIEASAPGYSPTVAARVVASLDPDPSALVLALWPEAVVRGVVVSSVTGEALAGATLKRFTAREPLRHGDPDDVHGRLIARTDAHGRFELRGVPAGAMSLAVEHPEHAFSIDGPFEVPRQGVLPERRIELGAGRTLSGFVRDVDGRALAGELVVLEARASTGLVGRDWKLESDAAGAFAFERLSTGTYELSHVLRGSGGVRVPAIQQRFVLEPEQDLAVELRPRGGATIVGGIEGDMPLPDDVPVRARPVGDVPSGSERALVRGTLAQGGRFELRGLAPGEYELEADRYDTGTRTRWYGQAQVRLDEGERAEVWIAVAER